MQKVKEIAGMIDHAVLHPTLSYDELKAGCAVALKWEVASICTQPYAIKNAVEWAKGSNVLIGTVIGFPQGSNHTMIKVKEAQLACMHGARELDMVVNVGQVIGQNWSYIADEINEIQKVALANKAVLKVIFETDFLRDKSIKIELCRICSDLDIDYVKTCTGFGMNKTDSGLYMSNGATDKDIRLMRKHCHKKVKIKASGGIRSLDDVLRLKKLGATRIGTSSTESIMKEAMIRWG